MPCHNTGIKISIPWHIPSGCAIVPFIHILNEKQKRDMKKRVAGKVDQIVSHPPVAAALDSPGGTN